MLNQSVNCSSVEQNNQQLKNYSDDMMDLIQYNFKKHPSNFSYKYEQIQEHPNMPIIETTEFPETNLMYTYYSLRSKTNSLYTNSIHRYPPKYIPDYSQWAIKKYLKQGGMIIDPFIGSGVTALTAIQFPYTNICGFDIDPLACLISKTKVTPLSEDKLLQIRDDIIDRVSHSKVTPYKPHVIDILHWFNIGEVEDLGCIRSIIDDYKQDVDIYNFLLVTFSSIIQKCSLVADRESKAFVSKKVIKIPAEAKSTFKNKLRQNVASIISTSKVISSSSSCHIGCCDAKEISDAYFKQSQFQADLAISSPPYINSFDYPRSTKLSYMWIGDILDVNNMNAHQRKFIGTEYISSEYYKKSNLTGVPTLDSQILCMFKKDKKKAGIVYKYFYDMSLHLREMTKVLKKGAHYILVVGTSNILGEEIMTHSHLTNIAIQHGFELDNIFASKILNKSLRNKRGLEYEWVLDLKKL
ncbi:MAG: hypothetical protein HQL06_08745 [Nitrospirae bacterium]|nr:hypothetical protein [Nitrospirota bacterium]